MLALVASEAPEGNFFALLGYSWLGLASLGKGLSTSNPDIQGIGSWAGDQQS